MNCPSCGTAAPEGARFCPSCGADMHARGDERRIVTVLFADIVAFTTLSETLDPEQVKNLVDSCFEEMVAEIERHGGRVDKIIGDAIVALFGAPVAHEDDAERAVRAALQMQELMAARRERLGVEVRMRIGVNTGEVLVGALRAGGEYTAMGDVVNTAQRLESSAEPDTVLVGRSTWLATRNVIEYEHTGPLDAKGKEVPVEAWIARSPILPPGYRPRRHTPIVGRAAELGVLHHALDSCVDRERAHLVLLLGEAGVGKTRLAEELAEVARSGHGALVLEGRCVPYGEPNVWWPVAEAVRQVAGLEADASPEEARERVTTSVEELLGEDREDRRADVVGGLLHLLGVGGSFEDIDPTRAREEAVRSLVAFVERASTHRPVVMVLSDLHWGDGAVLELLDELLDRLGRAPFYLVATARQELQDRWGARTGRHNVVVMNLDPLDRSAAEQLLGMLAEGEIPDEVRTLLLDRSGGNPFFLEELLALVGEGSSLEVRAGRAAEPTGPLDDLPDTLRGLVAARLDALGPAERSSLEDASVWGRSGPTEALRRMAEWIRGIEDLHPVLVSLADQDLLEVDGDTWSFRSDLVRDVAYSTLTKAERAKRHFGIASYLENHRKDPSAPVAAASREAVMTIARHYGAAAELLEELGSVDGVDGDVSAAALRWISEAANRAASDQSFRKARGLYDQALSLIGSGSPQERADLLLRRADVLSSLREAEASREDIDHARRLAADLGDASFLARADLAEGNLQMRSGDLVGAAASSARAVAAFRGENEPRWAAEALRALGESQLLRGEHGPAESAFSEALTISRELGDRGGVAWSIQKLAWISFVTGRPAEAASRLGEAVAIFEDLGDPGGLAWARGLLAYVRFQEGRFEEALALGTEVLEGARSRGDEWGRGMMLVLVGSIRQWSGQALEAVPVAEEALEVFRSIGDAYGQTLALSLLGRGLVALGRVEDGFAVLEAAGGIGRTGSEQDLSEIGVAALLNAAVQVGEPFRAHGALEAAELPAPVEGEAGRFGMAESERAIALGLLALQEGRVATAAEGLRRAAVHAQGEEPSPFALAALALAEAAEGRDTEVSGLRERVGSLPRTTYLDLAMVTVADVLVRVRRRDPDVGERLTRAIAQADGTDDLVMQAIARLAAAYGLEAAAEPGAAAMREDAERRLGDLGLDAPGWRNAIELILTATGEDRSPEAAPLR